MNLSVLFVDDSENVLSGIRRMMYPMNKEWKLLYANGRNEAINILDNNHVDVIVSDIRMPGIDGTQLLQEVKDKFPRIIRITLSGYASDELALKNSKIVHQSLLKPTSPRILKTTIERTIRLKEILNNDELQKVVNGLDTLPSLPEIYIKLENEINSPNTSIDKIGNIIANDPIITAKILQLTNSAFFGLPHNITNIKQALSFLGIKMIQTLVLTIKLFKAFEEKNKNSKIFKEVWDHSNKVALLARRIALLKSFSNEDTEDSYLSGLLHDIGELILLNNYSVEEINLQFSKTSHANIGAYLLGVWGLPDPIVEAVAFHHNYIFTEPDLFTPTKILFIAHKISYNNKFNIESLDETNINEIIADFDKDEGEDLHES
ncbi:MAG: HDOD domain-containing protein [Ignavibacteriae bacterium]|nr:HDOD domain-containing protein [Ignavibacteriota bacterium]